MSPSSTLSRKEASEPETLSILVITVFSGLKLCPAMNTISISWLNECFVGAVSTTRDLAGPGDPQGPRTPDTTHPTQEGFQALFSLRSRKAKGVLRLVFVIGLI